MTILSALADLYERMEEAGEAPPLGYSIEKIGGEVVLDAGGKVLAIRRLGAPDDKGKWQPRRLAFPAAVTRSLNIAPNLFSYNPAYVLALTALTADTRQPLTSVIRQPQPRLHPLTVPAPHPFFPPHPPLL